MPPDRLIWDGSYKELSSWIDSVLGKKSNNVMYIDTSEIE